MRLTGRSRSARADTNRAVKALMLCPRFQKLRVRSAPQHLSLLVGETVRSKHLRIAPHEGIGNLGLTESVLHIGEHTVGDRLSEFVRSREER